jgi:hypothetical protein
MVITKCKMAFQRSLWGFRHHDEKHSDSAATAIPSASRRNFLVDSMLVLASGRTALAQAQQVLATRRRGCRHAGQSPCLPLVGHDLQTTDTIGETFLRGHQITGAGAASDSPSHQGLP